MEKIKIGIIGCGGIANGKHMPSYKNLADEAEMVAFCDIIEERAQKANVEYAAGKGKVFTDYKKLLKEDLDAVCVCTPNVFAQRDHRCGAQCRQTRHLRKTDGDQLRGGESHARRQGEER